MDNISVPPPHAHRAASLRWPLNMHRGSRPGTGRAGEFMTLPSQDDSETTAGANASRDSHSVCLCAPSGTWLGCIAALSRGARPRGGGGGGVAVSACAQRCLRPAARFGLRRSHAASSPRCARCPSGECVPHASLPFNQSRRVGVSHLFSNHTLCRRRCHRTLTSHLGATRPHLSTRLVFQVYRTAQPKPPCTRVLKY